MCSRAPVHIPGHCPPPPSPINLVQTYPSEGVATTTTPWHLAPADQWRREYQRRQEVRRRYPPGPWPFQKARAAADGSAR